LGPFLFALAKWAGSGASGCSAFIIAGALDRIPDGSAPPLQKNTPPLWTG